MESLGEGSKSTKGFFKHVFNFDEDSKEEMMNIVQYSLLSLVPIVLLNKSMQKYVPEADEQKGSLEILAEIVIQVIVMFIGILIVHRIITYIPTYSGSKYPDFSVTGIILAVLLIVLSLQTKLGEKITIIVDRITELWEGKQNDKNKKKSKAGNNNVKVSQPIAQMNSGIPPPPPPMMNQPSSMNYSDGTSINQLPNEMSSSSQQLPNYNNMYQQDSTPLVGAATPGYENFQSGGVLPASEVLGGSFGGSTW
jgi:hypothetical protein